MLNYPPSEAGAELVQLFDSWAGVLPEPAFAQWVIEPTKRIVSALERRFAIAAVRCDFSTRFPSDDGRYCPPGDRRIYRD
jgi:Uroporphyrinogen decarboxylase (URO-D)